MFDPVIGKPCPSRFYDRYFENDLKSNGYSYNDDLIARFYGVTVYKSTIKGRAIVRCNHTDKILRTGTIEWVIVEVKRNYLFYSVVNTSIKFYN